MSDRLTSVGPRNVDSKFGGRGIGFEHYGGKSRKAMIAAYRQHYAGKLAEATYALSLSDDELIVETYVGAYSQKGRKEVTD